MFGDCLHINSPLLFVTITADRRTPYLPNITEYHRVLLNITEYYRISPISYWHRICTYCEEVLLRAKAKAHTASYANGASGYPTIWLVSVLFSFSSNLSLNFCDVCKYIETRYWMHIIQGTNKFHLVIFLCKKINLCHAGIYDKSPRTKAPPP